MNLSHTAMFSFCWGVEGQSRKYMLLMEKTKYYLLFLFISQRMCIIMYWCIYSFFQNTKPCIVPVPIGLTVETPLKNKSMHLLNIWFWVVCEFHRMCCFSFIYRQPTVLSFIYVVLAIQYLEVLN